LRGGGFTSDSELEPELELLLGAGWRGWRLVAGLPRVPRVRPLRALRVPRVVPVVIVNMGWFAKYGCFLCVVIKPRSVVCVVQTKLSISKWFKILLKCLFLGREDSHRERGTSFFI